MSSVPRHEGTSFTLSQCADTSSSSTVTPLPSQLTPESDTEESDIEVYSKDDRLGQSFEQKRVGRDPGKNSKTRSASHDEHDEAETDEEEEEAIEKERDTLQRTNSFSPAFTPEEERAVIKKFDRRLVLFMALLYMLSFLDRSNIGNAKIAGLSHDLELTSSQYEWLLTAFYITYILFEWMTLMYRLVPPHIYISLCVFAWGLLASLQSLATSFWSLTFLRALLGISEAAFGPGVPFYLSFFFKREELAFRVGLFIAAAPLATSFASSLAWVIVKVSSHGPIAPWRALFLVEGFPSVLVAVFAWFHVPDSPGKARYLTHRERKVAKLRLNDFSTSHHDSSHKMHGLDWREIGQALSDPKCYLTALMFFCCNVSFSSLPVFLPTILHAMGYTSLRSQALSAPPYLFAFICVILTAYLSSRVRSHSPFIIFHALLSSAAYTLIAVVGALQTHLTPWQTTLLRYMGVYGAAAGFFSAITIIITWTINNQRGASGKGTGMAILNLVGQCGPLVGTRLYPESDGPYYVRGMSVCAVFMVGVVLLAGGLRWRLGVENRRLGIEEEGMGIEMEEEAGVGEGLMGGGVLKRRRKADAFRYIL